MKMTVLYAIVLFKMNLSFITLQLIMAIINNTQNLQFSLQIINFIKKLILTEMYLAKKGAFL